MRTSTKLIVFISVFIFVWQIISNITIFGPKVIDDVRPSISEHITTPLLLRKDVVETPGKVGYYRHTYTLRSPYQMWCLIRSFVFESLFTTGVKSYGYTPTKMRTEYMYMFDEVDGKPAFVPVTDDNIKASAVGVFSAVSDTTGRGSK